LFLARFLLFAEFEKPRSAFVAPTIFDIRALIRNLSLAILSASIGKQRLLDNRFAKFRNRRIACDIPALGYDVVRKSITNNVLLTIMASHSKDGHMSVEVMDYDLTLMAGEVLEVINGGKGFMGVTDSQRKKLDKITRKYAARAVKILSDHSE